MVKLALKPQKKTVYRIVGTLKLATLRCSCSCLCCIQMNATKNKFKNYSIGT